MFTKLLAATIFTVGIATSAMAQYSSGASTDMQTAPLPDTVIVDPNTTGSISDMGVTTAPAPSSLGNPGPVGPCANDTAGPDANHGLVVNDNYCGK